MDFLDGLNEPQQKAVSASPGPTIVLAGPGSGKTRVLTHRIAYLIRHQNVAPWHILAVTFTNKAAREMNHRIEALLDGKQQGLMMGTFHSTCVRILRRETANLTYYDRDFVIFDTADQLQVVKQALADLNLDNKKFTPNKMLNGISSAKNELITPDIYAANNYVSEINRRVYHRYQELLQANNAMDFDDLLLNTVHLFDKQPEVLQKYQTQYQHILVDEFQDTNTVQYALLKRLAAIHNNLFVVGDSDQSIYRWRGADFRNLQRFRDEYPSALMVLLEQNYRSTQIILDAAKSVIRHNPDRVDKDLFTNREGGEVIQLREAYNETEEAQFVISTIQDLMLRGRSGSDFAVMYRTNSQSRSLEEAFVRANMPYRLVGATQFYKRREIKDIIAYLRVIHNPADAISLNRVINTPTRGIGAKTQQTLTSWARQHGWQPTEALIYLATNPEAQHPFRGRAYNALTNFGKMLFSWMQLRDKASVSELFDTILDQIDYRNYLDDGTEEGRDRWYNVLELRTVTGSDESTTLSDFLEQIALVSETDNLEETTNAPTLLTLHAAKGLEFPIVLITGLEDGVLPHSRSLADGEELAEERRLFYVGITRAKDRLYLSHAFRRTYFGETEVTIPSRFLQDIPMDLIISGSSSSRRQAAKSRASTWQWSSGSNSSRGNTSRGGSSRGSSSRGGSSRNTASRTSTTRRATAQPATPPPKPNLPQPSLWDEEEWEEEETAVSSARTSKFSYKSGEKVRHSKFGEGTVIESKSVGNDEEVTVAFPSVGIKRLAASFAKLEKID